MSVNAHSVFYQRAGTADFLHRLNLSDEELKQLRSARDLVRNHLVSAFRNWEDWLNREPLFVETYQKSLQPPALKPRFRQQGSITYHTINRPAWTPPQEVDLDDGLFLATEMLLREAGQTEPAILTGGLFTITRNALSSLCRQQDWAIELKDTCIRIKLNHGSAAHIDLPIYAIPEKQYQQIEDSLTAINKQFATQDASAINLVEEAYRQLASGEIMLAHRVRGWIRSDPRQLENWFNDAVKRYGDQLRRVCRYLKAWRDHNWEKGGPSSIALMACVVAAYKSNPKHFDENRDDRAVLRVASQLVALFEDRIANPVVPDLYLDDGWDEKGIRSSYIEAAQRLRDSVSGALTQSQSAQQVLSGLSAAFGARIPSDASLVVFPPAVTPDEVMLKTAPLAPTIKPKDSRSYA